MAVDGGSYDSPAHHVVLRGRTIRDIGPEGNRDAIKRSCLDNFGVQGCTIERWGSSRLPQCEIVGCTFRYRSDPGDSSGRDNRFGNLFDQIFPVLLVE